MNELIDLIKGNAVRGACMCGQCIDAPQNPAKHQPVSEHTADVQFFKVALYDPSVDKEKVKERLIKILTEYKGEFNEVNLLDGNEHNFMQIGGYVGDQGLALTLMGLGELLRIWELYTPNSMVPFLDDGMKMKMAGMGMVSVRCLPEYKK